MDRKQTISRRDFFRTSVLVPGAIGILGCQGSNKSKSQSGLSRLTDSNISKPTSEPDLLASLEKEINTIQAFNNHLHTGAEIKSLNWYFTGNVIGKSKSRYNKLTEDLVRLLNLPVSKEFSSVEKEQLRDKYTKFCKTRSLRDYYHALADLTNTSHIVFMVNYWSPENKNLASDRIKLVPWASHWMFPLDNSSIKNRHPRCAMRIKQCERRLQDDEEALGPRPSSFQGYLNFIRKTLEMYRKTPNVIGVKLGFAYFRSLQVQTVDIKQAKRVYESQDSNPEAYKKLQDYLAFHILKTCTELELPLQIHTGLGADAGLVLNQSNASNLDLLFSRPELETAHIACIHGSYPYCKELGVIARRKNVWIDFSWMVLLLGPHKLATYLKEWIEIAGPNKIMFGVDGSGLAQIAGTRCARRALAIALAEFVEEQYYTQQQAISVAQRILSKNAMKFYKSTIV